MKAIQHLVLFYEQTSRLWKQCATLHKTLQPTFWMYISDEHKTATVKQALTTATLSTENGTIGLSEQFLFRQTIIRVPSIMNALKKEIILQRGKSENTFLLFIEMTWAVRTPSGAIYLREYEAAIHQLAAELSIAICCMYNQSVMLDDQLMTAIQTHPHLVTLAGIKENPYFIPPNIFAKRNQKSQFRYWLKKIESPLSVSDDTMTEAAASLKTPSEEAENIYNIDTPTILISSNSEQGRWKIRCLGELKIYREQGTLVEWNTKGGATRKLKTIFAYLLYKGEKGASIEELVDLLWPDMLDLKQGTNRLYHSIRYLRKILSPNLVPNTPSPFILNRDNKYFLAVPADTWIDLPMFQELCFKGNAHLRRGDLGNALIAYQSAERLYRGDLLASIPSKYIENIEQDWCWSRRYWFKDMNHKLLYGIAGIHRQLGNIVEALNYCDKALTVFPSSEMAHQEKMKTFFAANRLDALKRQYRLYCKSLEQFNMGKPSAATKNLFEKLISKNN